MLTDIDYVEANKFPRDVRATLNDLVERDNRDWEVRITEDNSPNGCRVIESDDKMVIVIARGALRQPALLFNLIVVDATHIRVTISTIAGHIPTGFTPSDNPPFILSVSGNGYVYAEITYDPTTGDISSWDIKKDATVPDDDSTHTRCALGTFTTTGSALSCLNTGYGPVNSVACRQFFVSGVPFTRSLLVSS